MARSAPRSAPNSYLLVSLRCQLRWLVCYNQVLRLLQLLVVAIAVLIGQAEGCQLHYVRADGTPCPSCPRTPCLQPAAHVAVKALAPAADCKQCCHLRACGTTHGPGPLASSPILVSAEFAILPAIIPAIQSPVQWRNAVSVHIAASLPNAPPISTTGRSPPIPLS